jgi:hypothetical protein
MTNDIQPPPPVGPVKIQNGTYTIAHEERGSFIVKLYTVTDDRSDLKGKRIVALQVQPGSERFDGVGFWDEEKRFVFIWRKHRSMPDRVPSMDGISWWPRWNSIEKRVAIWLDMNLRGATAEEHGVWFNAGYRQHREGRCWVCNRLLTDPESILMGIGPVCAGRKTS